MKQKRYQVSLLVEDENLISYLDHLRNKKMLRVVMLDLLELYRKYPHELQALQRKEVLEKQGIKLNNENMTEANAQINQAIRKMNNNIQRVKSLKNDAEFDLKDLKGETLDIVLEDMRSDSKQSDEERLLQFLKDKGLHFKGQQEQRVEQPKVETVQQVSQPSLEMMNTMMSMLQTMQQELANIKATQTPTPQVVQSHPQPQTIPVAPPQVQVPLQTFNPQVTNTNIQQEQVTQPIFSTVTPTPEINPPSPTFAQGNLTNNVVEVGDIDEESIFSNFL